MIDTNSLCRDLNCIRQESPLIHNITNYVAMNNTANALLAIGASPVMAHAVQEVEQLVLAASALVLNIGTLDEQWVEGMLLAGKTALENHIPIVFDPVGAGATFYRSEVCLQILKECRPSIIKGNASEIIALAGINKKTKGVDSVDTSEEAIDAAQLLALRANAVIVISGQVDYITDGKIVEAVYNGAPMMARVTGMGCISAALIAAFAAVNSTMLAAAIHGMVVMGIGGELATRNSRGNGSFQANFLDEMYNLNDNTIRFNLKLEI